MGFRVLISIHPQTPDLELCIMQIHAVRRPWMWTDLGLRLAIHIQGRNLPSRGRDPEDAGPALTRTRRPHDCPTPPKKVAIVCSTSKFSNLRL